MFILNTFYYINDNILTVWLTKTVLMFWLDGTAQKKPCIRLSCFFLTVVHDFMNHKLSRIIFDWVQTPTHRGKKKKKKIHHLPTIIHPSPPAISDCFLSKEPLQPQLAWSSSVRVRISVTRPVPMVLFPSRRVNLCPFSRTIGWRSVSINEVSSPGIIISWGKEKAERWISQKKNAT